jgi:hypothetical protein
LGLGGAFTRHCGATTPAVLLLPQFGLTSKCKMHVHGGGRAALLMILVIIRRHYSLGPANFTRTVRVIAFWKKAGRVRRKWRRLNELRKALAAIGVVNFNLWRGKKWLPIAAAGGVPSRWGC